MINYQKKLIRSENIKGERLKTSKRRKHGTTLINHHWRKDQKQPNTGNIGNKEILQKTSTASVATPCLYILERTTNSSGVVVLSRAEVIVSVTIINIVKLQRRILTAVDLLQWIHTYHQAIIVGPVNHSGREVGDSLPSAQLSTAATTTCTSHFV